MHSQMFCCFIEFLGLTGDEGSYWAPLVLKGKMFSAEKLQILDQLLGWDDTEPSTRVTYNLHPWLKLFIASNWGENKKITRWL